MVRRAMVMASCLAVAMLLWVVPQRCPADSSAGKQKNEEKKQNKEKKGTKKDAEPNGKAKSTSDPVNGVNKMYDGFKKNQGSVKGDAEKVKKSVNDTWKKNN